jgi:hypothetical protein
MIYWLGHALNFIGFTRDISETYIVSMRLLIKRGRANYQKLPETSKNHIHRVIKCSEIAFILYCLIELESLKLEDDGKGILQNFRQKGRITKNNSQITNTEKYRYSQC